MDIKKEKEQLQLLESLILRGKEYEALNIIEKLDKDLSDSFQIKFTKAKVLIKLKKNVSAEEILKSLEKSHYNNLNLLWVMSDFFSDIQKKEKSLEYLNKICFIDPFSVDIKEKIKNLEVQIERKKLPTADTLPEVQIEKELDLSIKASENISNNMNDNDIEEDFITMSAARVYVNQGLFKDALIILEKIYQRDKSNDILIKIERVKSKIKAIKKVEILTLFMDRIKMKGVNFV